jgi:hypothetical protein
MNGDELGVGFDGLHLALEDPEIPLDVIRALVKALEGLPPPAGWSALAG